MKTANHNIKLVGLVERFKQPPPVWYAGLKEEAYKKIIEAPFSEQCRQGNREVMKKLTLDLWPFVSVFPTLVRKGYFRLSNPMFFLRHGVFNMTSLIYRSMMFLTSIERDEKTHRALWLDMGTALGFEYPKDFDKKNTSQTQAWIDEVAYKTDPTDMFLAFVAIEIIAESVSKNFVLSQPFQEVLGEKGIGWFNAHVVDHGDISHENLELHLAATFDSFDESTDIEEKARKVIFAVVDKFLLSANACV